MRKPIVFPALLAGLLFVSANLWAVERPKEDPDYKDEPTAVTATDLEILSNKINDLAKFGKVNVLLKAQYINGDVAPGTPGLPKGFAHPVPTPAAGASKYNDVFLGRTAEISFAGDLNDKKIAYRFQWDPLASASPGKAGVSANDQIKDYWIRLSYLNFVDVQAGQFKYPQGLEGRTSSGEIDFVNVANLTTAFANRRDLALQVSGSKIPLPGGLPWTFEYAVALVKGSGQNAAENNDHKDPAGRVGLTLTDLGLYLGASAYSGFQNTSATFANRGYRDDLGYEFRYTLDKFKLQGEFIQGHQEIGNNFNPVAAGRSLPQGFYVTAQYRYEDLRLGVRAESYDSNVLGVKTVGGGNWNNDTLTVGLDWFQAKDKFRLTLNWENHLRQYEVLFGQAQVNI